MTAVTAEIDPPADAEHRLADLVSGLRVAMVTTVDAMGAINSRPLVVQHVEGGHLFFLVHADAEWLPTAAGGPVAATLTDEHRWISLTGTAHVEQEAEAIEALAGPAARTWFTGDPLLEGAVLVLDSIKVDFWTSPGKAAQVFAVAKGLLTGGGTDLGRHGHLEL